MSSTAKAILAIETSQRVGGVALRVIGGDISVEMLSGKKRHDDDLLPAIDRLVKRAGLTPADLHAVGVSVGPGGFTGLRIAISAAKMLGEFLGAKLVAAPSALVVAEGTGSAGTNVIVALASKNDTAWCTRLTRDDAGAYQICATPAAGIADAHTLELSNVDALIADEHLPPTMRERCAREGVPVIEPVFDPRACLIVAERLLAAGVISDPVSLLPLYPRQPEAVTLWNAKPRAGQ